MMFRSLALALAASIAVAAPASAYADEPVAAQRIKTSVAPTQPNPSSDDAQQYAQRERQAPQAANYRGGDVLVIGISGAAAVVVIVVLLLLI